MGEVGEMVVEAVGGELLNRLRNPLMHHLSPLDQYRVVRRLLGERVLEHVLDIAIISGLLVDELGELELGQRPLQLLLGSSNHFANEPKSEVLADDRHSLEQLLLRGGQPVDTG